MAESARRHRGFSAASYLVAFGVLAVSIPTILSGAFDFQPFRKIIEWSPAATVGGSIASSLVGLSLLFTLKSDRRAGLLTAGIGTTVAASIILAREWWLAVSGSAPSIAAGLLLGSAAAGLISTNLTLTKQTQQIVLGLIGVVIVSLALTLLGIRSASIFDQATDAYISGISVQSLLSGGLLGVLFLVGVWVTGLPETSSPPIWLPISAGLAAMVIVIVLWRAFVERERHHVLEHTQLAATVGRHHLRRSIDLTSNTMIRIATWLSNGAEGREVAGTFRRVLEDFPGLTALAWIKKSGEAVVVPEQTEEVTRADRLSAARLSPIAPGRESYFSLDSVAGTVAIVAPICPENRCTSRVIGILDVGHLATNTLGDSTAGFRYGLAGISPADESSLSREFQRQETLTVGTIRWTITARPTQTILSSIRSDLPTATLFFGLLVAGLLATSFRLGQLARFNARQAAHDRISAALDRSTDGIWELDLETGAAARSRALWNYLQYPTPPIGRDRWFDLVHPDDRLLVDEQIKRHLNGHSDRFEVQYRIQAGDGSWHQMVDRGRVVDRSPTGRPLRMLGICADITEATAAAQARDESQRRFRAAFDGAFHYQMVLSIEGNIIEANQAISAQVRDTDQTFRGVPCWTAFWWGRHGLAADRLREAVEAARKGETRRYVEDFSHDEPGGPVLELVIAPIAGDDQQFTEMLLEARDDTARRRAEAALQEVSTLTIMGRVAARVAHEINNPLAGIQNAFLLIKDAVSPDHPHHLYVAAIEREIARIASVTRQLYETYRPDTESTAETSVATIVGDAAALLGQLNKATGVKIETQITDLPAVIPLPSALVRQVVFNLVQNAVDASEPGGLVSVKTNVADGALRILVRDRGPGIPAELKAKVFEPFFSTKRHDTKTGGMGIGLWLVRRSVTAVGGQVTADNADGGGAEFIVEIPIRASRSGSNT